MKNFLGNKRFASDIQWFTPSYGVALLEEPDVSAGEVYGIFYRNGAHVVLESYQPHYATGVAMCAQLQMTLESVTEWEKKTYPEVEDLTPVRNNEPHPQLN